MPGRTWDTDAPGDTARLAGNATALVQQFRTDAAPRHKPTLATVCDWHRRLYDGCSVLSDAYRGGLRGDTSRPDLVGYEVGVGPMQPDGLPEKVGVWSREVQAALTGLFSQLSQALPVLDARFPVGTRPVTVDELAAVIGFIAAVHGEWIRIHPFANGNGRAARLLAAFLALRYGLPVFVIVKPRPDDVGYVRAGRAAMGRPPAFAGDHTQTQNVFTHLLVLARAPVQGRAAMAVPDALPLLRRSQESADDTAAAAALAG